MIVNLEAFVARARPKWEELDKTLQRFEHDRFCRLSFEQSTRLFELYQHCAADLARLQESSQPELFEYLESVVARAYTHIHSVRKPARVHPFRWLTQTLPQTFRRQFRAFVAATLLLVLGSGTGVLLLAIDPDAKSVLMPFPHLLNDPNERVKQEEKDKGKQLNGHQIAFSAYLVTHNISVAFLSMAAGMTFGLGTILMVFSNGVDIGAVCADYVHAGQGAFLAGWLLPHGVFEIPALLVASQAGFLLASALIGWRSRLSRAARLRHIAPDVYTLSMGAALMLVWAGLIESFISQYHAPVLPYSAKIGFALIELAFLIWFFTKAGTRRRRKT
ncbi:MAG: stage II sporulation protein M [Acidobacteriaceae bacterium]|nr:stage II sporulation protein M [Acidobacteriaceae bacterium]